MSEQAKSLPVATIDKILAAPGVPEGTVDIPEWGCSVRVRGLKRNEADRVVLWNVQGLASIEDIESRETFVLSRGLIEPKLSEEQVRELREKSFTAVGTILDKITELTFIGEEAVKAAQITFRDGES